jgi:hypothetical protein
MFTIFDPVPLSSKAPRWAAKVPRYSEVFGYSHFADLFICSSDGTNFAVLCTERPELIQLNFRSKKEFVEQLLTNSDVLKSTFRAADFSAIVSRLGSPSPESCFYPVPYPATGGSGALDTYQSGNVWVHLDIYAQAIGV